jgi:hypothetical protein
MVPERSQQMLAADKRYRARRKGELAPFRPIADALWLHASNGDGCWEWQRGKDSFGYGYVFVSPQRGMVRVARWVFELLNGPIPPDMVVMHICDNPPCIRPEHLRLGTQADNVADMYAKGRHSTQRRES